MPSLLAQAQPQLGNLTPLPCLSGSLPRASAVQFLFQLKLYNFLIYNLGQFLHIQLDIIKKHVYLMQIQP